LRDQWTARGRGLALAALTLCTSAATAQAAAQQPPEASQSSTSVSITGERTDKVRYGKRVRVAGTVSPAAAGRGVSLEYAQSGGRFKQVATTTTAPDGSYRFQPRARRSGSYRALSGGATTSASKRVTVIGSLKARTSTRHSTSGRKVRASGRLLPAVRGRKVKLQVRSGRRWRTVDVSRTGSGGRIRTAWRPSSPGRHKLRLRFAGDRLAAAAGHRLRVNSYRAGHASWYGPGLYGNTLGCGGTLTPSTVGVAHKSLPCGTRVTFRYRGRSVTARVIDRGPYIAGREWDLTEALKHKLRFGSTGTVFTTR